MANATLRPKGQLIIIRAVCHFCAWQQSASGVDPQASGRRLRDELLAHVESTHADRFPIEPAGDVGTLHVPIPGRQPT